MIVLVIVAGYFTLTALIVISVSVLSARMSKLEDWEEAPIVEQDSDAQHLPDYQTDVATS